jgi:hypothetical protein
MLVYIHDTVSLGGVLKAGSSRASRLLLYLNSMVKKQYININNDEPSLFINAFSNQTSLDISYKLSAVPGGIGGCVLMLMLMLMLIQCVMVVAVVVVVM